MDINAELVGRYTLRTTNQATRPGCWDVVRCEILDNGEYIGEYVYTYHGTPPFHPFEQDGKHFALYSTQYTATRVMELPSCKDLCGEEATAFGFCPTGFAVPFEAYCAQDPGAEAERPRNPRQEDQQLYWVDGKFPEANTPGREVYDAAVAAFDVAHTAWMERWPFKSHTINAQFGFVCGCAWGDDGSWKIQYLDLSRIQEGILRRDARMGYIELLGGADKLAEAIDVDMWEPGDQQVRISCAQTFDLQKSVT